MIETFIYTSDNGNSYIYNEQRRLSMLVHPEFEKVFNKTKDVDPYYLKKYDYLAKHRVFDSSERLKYVELEESMVKESVMHTKQVVFEVTDACNLNCTYCSVGDMYEGHDERIGQKINTDYAIALLKYIFSLKQRNDKDKLYISFYGGEALLNMKFIKEIVKVANYLNINKEIELIFTMTTNATLIHKYIDFLVEHRFNLLVSLDGNEYNHSYRVYKNNKNNSFSDVIRNIDSINKNYPDYFSVYVNFNAVLHDRNSVRSISEFIFSRYNKIPRITELNIRDAKPEKKVMLEGMFRFLRKSESEFQQDNLQLSEVMHDKTSLYRELTDFIKYFTVNFYVANIDDIFHNEETHLPTCTCIPFGKKIFLTSQNKLLPCERVNYKYSLGLVNNTIEINTLDIVRKYNHYYDKISTFCEKCYVRNFCGICLFHINNIDNIDDDDFTCDQFHDQELFKNKLRRIISFLENNPKDLFEIIEVKVYE